MALFEFGDYSYQEITLKEKLLEVLSYLLRIGDFKQYAGKTILNNVYMDLRGKKPVFKRTKTAMERNNIFATIRRYAKKLKPQYNGDNLKPFDYFEYLLTEIPKHAEDKNTDFLTEFLPWSKSLLEHIRKSKKAVEK